MAPISNLRVINENSSEIVREFLIDCEDVFFYKDGPDALYLVGYVDATLRIIPVMNPGKAQIIELKDDIVTCQSNVVGIYALLGGNKIECFTIGLNGDWTSAKQADFSDILPATITAFLPAGDDFFVCTRSENRLAVWSASNIVNVKQMAEIDMIEVAGVPVLCLSPLSKPDGIILLMGTADGHVYQLSLNGDSSLMCDIQQPVLSIRVYLEDCYVFGRYGKIVQMNCRSQKAAAHFAPSAIMECSNDGNHVYLKSNFELYSIEVKGDHLGEVDYCPVKFVRSFFLANQSVRILTEDGVIYQVDSNFKQLEKNSATTGREGDGLRCLLEEIHKSANGIRQLNGVNQKAADDLEQVSTALKMLNDDVMNKFPLKVKSFADFRGQGGEVLHLVITNGSPWTFPASHWTLQVTLTGCHSARFCRQFSYDWEKESSMTMEQHLLMAKSEFSGVVVDVALVFHAESEPQLTQCVFPISKMRINILDLLQAIMPVNFQQFVMQQVNDKSAKVTASLGFKRTSDGYNPWQLLLPNCWHRGFSQLDFSKEDSGKEVSVTARYGDIPIRMTVTYKNSLQKLLILRIETYNQELLDRLRTEMFDQLSANNADKPEFVDIPAQATVDLQNLSTRLNYIQSLGDGHQCDAEALHQEFRLFIAENLPVI